MLLAQIFWCNSSWENGDRRKEIGVNFSHILNTEVIRRDEDFCGLYGIEQYQTEQFMLTTISFQSGDPVTNEVYLTALNLPIGFHRGFKHLAFIALDR